MPVRSPFLALAILGAACFAFATTTSAQKILSIGKQYAYFKTVPGQPPNHYMDDGPINGPHKVHTSGLGTYDLGNLSDGAVSTSAGGGPGTTHLALWAQCCGNAPPADIIFDLGRVEVISDFVIGTVVAAVSNNNAPDDVTISYSITGTSYGSAQFYDLEKLYGPLQDGHHDMSLKVGTFIPARYVKFSFDGGSMKEPSGQDPDEKWLLDEITIIGVGSTCRASSSNYGPGLAGTRGVPTLAVSAPPKFLSKINVMVANSSGAATTGLLIAGLKQTTIPFLGGILLVDPLVQAGLPVPAAGLVFPITIPGPPCGPPICLQFLQLDAGAVSGVSMTPGLRLDLGT